jgi:hypothetical protein
MLSGRVGGVDSAMVVVFCDCDVRWYVLSLLTDGRTDGQTACFMLHSFSVWIEQKSVDKKTKTKSNIL